MSNDITVEATEIDPRLAKPEDPYASLDVLEPGPPLADFLTASAAETTRYDRERVEKQVETAQKFVRDLSPDLREPVSLEPLPDEAMEAKIRHDSQVGDAVRAAGGPLDAFDDGVMIAEPVDIIVDPLPPSPYDDETKVWPLFEPDGTVDVLEEEEDVDLYVFGEDDDWQYAVDWYKPSRVNRLRRWVAGLFWDIH